MIDFTGTPALYGPIVPERLRLADLKEQLDIFASEEPAARLEGPPAASDVQQRIAAETQAALAKGRYQEAVFQAGRCLTRYLKRPPEEQPALRALYDAVLQASRDHEALGALASNEYGAQQFISFIARLARAIERTPPA